MASLIAGPVAVRTRAGLEAVLSGRVELLEHGLAVVASRIELPDVGRVAVLARDAAGLPVLVFTLDADAVLVSAAQALQVHAHLVAQPWLLERLFEHRLPATPADGVRVILIGHRIDAAALSVLASLSLPDLTVSELHEWTVAGQRECALRPVLVRPARIDGGFSPPSATPAALVGVAREVMSWLERLDVDVTVEADRYARTVRARGRRLCTLAVEGPELCLHLADGERAVLASRDEAMAAMDRAMALFAAGLQPTPPPAPRPTDSVAGEDGDPDLRDLRRRVADVRVTRAETDALQLGDAIS